MLAYGSNVAGSCRQPYGTVFKKSIIQVSKTIKITYSSFEVQELKKLKYGLKAQKLQKQHALKGQKLLAQGIALGMMAISKTPCKGKSFMFCLEF